MQFYNASRKKSLPSQSLDFSIVIEYSELLRVR